MWLLLSKAVFNIHDNPGYYEALRDCEYPEYYGKIIEADVRRTLEKKSEETQGRLKDILRCLAIRNPYVGYCQGMNFIVNFLIGMGFAEEECFWVAVEVFEEVLPKNYYTNMLGVAIDIKLVEVFLRLKRPDVFNKLQELGVTISIFALEWLVCLGTTILPQPV
jgi:hypothetical protein